MELLVSWVIQNGKLLSTEVENSTEAEAILHEHFDHLRVEDSRELFYVDDPSISSISLDLVDGKIH